MKYSRFEQLPVWQAATDLFLRIDATAAHAGYRRKGDLLDQVLRASLSISNNIAEGFESGTTQQLLTFLYHARGSAGEVRSMLTIMERIEGFADPRSEISNLKSLAESISRQLRGWADSLQNSEIKGPRYLNETDREQADRRRRVAMLDAEMKQIVADARASRDRSTPQY